MRILFDPNCSICTQIKFILSGLDIDGQFTFTPITDHEIYQHIEGLNYWEARKTIHVIDKDNKVYKSEHAVLKILEQIRLVKKLGPILSTQLGIKLTAIAYQALNEYRLRKIEDCPDCQV